MISVTFALPQESSGLRRELRGLQHAGKTKAGPVLTGSLNGHPIVLCHIGMGRNSAMDAGKQLIDQFHPTLVICSGFAGGLSDELQVGDVVFDAQKTLYPAPRTAQIRSFAGKIAASDQALETPLDKAALHRETGALAVDMESAAIAEVCVQAGIPMIGLRAISDSARDSLPVPMDCWFDLERQRPRALRLLLYLAQNPNQILPFTRFLRGLPPARTALTRALLTFIADVSRSQGLAP
jgi:adenosylhomocysteine nucleosidase